MLVRDGTNRRRFTIARRQYAPTTDSALHRSRSFALATDRPCAHVVGLLPARLNQHLEHDVWPRLSEKSLRYKTRLAGPALQQTFQLPEVETELNKIVVANVLR